MKKKVKLLVVDVDGTMTDAGIYYDEHGNELKKFCTKDAAGFFAAHKSGIKIMVLTGRECAATTRRMTELKVDYLFQNVKDKLSFLKKFMQENEILKEEVGLKFQEVLSHAGVFKRDEKGLEAFDKFIKTL